MPVSVAGQESFKETGTASWYGRRHHGRITASGERYNMYALTAAHKKLPFGTLVRVRQQKTGTSVIVRITDRGPYVKGRIIDLSYAASRGLEMDGITKVSIEIAGKKDGSPLSGQEEFHVRLSKRPSGQNIAGHLERIAQCGIGGASRLLCRRGEILTLRPFSNFKDAHKTYMGIAKAYPTASIILEKKGSMARAAAH